MIVFKIAYSFVSMIYNGIKYVTKLKDLKAVKSGMLCV